MTEPTPCLRVELRETGVEFDVHVQPSASVERIGGLRGRALRLRVHAPPREGEANAAVCQLVARSLGVRPAAVELRAGARSRLKRLFVAGEPAALLSRIQALSRAERPGKGPFDGLPAGS